MSCTKCKQKDSFREEIENTTGFISKGAVWFIVIWSLFAVYGIYSLISKFL